VHCLSDRRQAKTSVSSTLALNPKRFWCWPLAQKGQPIRGPWNCPVRVAVLDAWFPVDGKARFVRDWRALRAYRPEAIAGTPAALRSLARMLVDELVEPFHLEYGLIVFTGPGRPRLDYEDRDLLWRAFGAPAFEEFRDAEGNLLAYECELRSGLHVAPGVVAGDLARQLGGYVLGEACPCGRPGSRVVVASRWGR